MQNDELITSVNNELALELPVSISMDQLKEQLIVYINDLINHDFEKLIYYLYRIDVHEEKIKKMLLQHEGENAADIIAQLIIDRQLQKINFRKEFQSPSQESDEEKW
ncbi:MAG: hypothetical protein QM725_15000 [Lacibacter sp.]